MMLLHNKPIGFRWSDALPRLVSDYAAVHGSMLIALAASVAYNVSNGFADVAADLMFRHRIYYLTAFLPLSLLFPVTFHLLGFYTRSRSYAGRYKYLVVLQGALLSSLLLLAANYLLFRTDVVPRSAFLTFSLLLAATLTASRLFKYWFASSLVAVPPSSAGAVDRASNPILVVGGAGYIGAIVAAKLLGRGYKVRILDSLVYGGSAITPLLDNPNLEFLHGDCRHIQDIVKAMAGVSSVIHLAAIVGDPACDQDSSNALEINYAATRMMVEIAKGNGVERFVFSSSCSVYGASEFLMDELSAVQPISLYAETKVASEKVLLDARTQTFHPTVLRFATVFGLAPRPRFDLVVNLLAAKAHQEGVITIYNGEQWRPFIHVDDVAEAVIATVLAPAHLVSGETFNVGDSRLNLTLSQLASIIRDHFPETVVANIENEDRRNYRVSFEKIKSQLGFECRLTVEDGVAELKSAFETGLIADYRAPAYSNAQSLRELGAVATLNPLSARIIRAIATDDSLRESA